MAIAILAAVAAVLAYSIGIHRGFSRGYYAALFDLSVGEPEEYVEILLDDDEISQEHLDRFGAQIDAGRKGRN